jgi:hypothetical protein
MGNLVRAFVAAQMIACHGRMQRECKVIHVITERRGALSDLLGSVGERRGPLPIEYGRGDGGPHPGAYDGSGGWPVCDIFVPDLRPGARIEAPPRDFR